MLNFRNLSLRRKQTLIMMLTSTIVLLVACAAFVTYDAVTFRRELVDNVSTTADIIANNCTAALDFNSPQVAEEALASLRGEPNIVTACVYDRRGSVFAVYERDGTNDLALLPVVASAGHEFTGKELYLFKPIIVRGEAIGTIYLAHNLQQLDQRMKSYIGIVALVLALSLLVAFGVSSRLQRLVSDPILQLAQVTRSVALEKNYALRATKQSEDELGQLVDGFNEMLWQVQQRDAALQSAQHELEARVIERTTELANANVALQLENAERQRAGTALLESKRFLQSTLDALSSHIAILDEHGTIVEVNAAWKRFAQENGFRGRLEGVGDNYLKVCDSVVGRCSSEAPAVASGIRAIMAGQSNEFHLEYPCHSPQEPRWFIVRATRFRGDGLLRVVMSHENITLRKRAEELLRRTETLYRSAIAGAGAVPYSLDFKSKAYEFIGDGIRQLIGYAPHEVNGALWKRITQKSIMLGEAASLDKDAAAERVRAGALLHWRCDMLITTHDGRSRWISDASVQNLDESGQVVGSVGILQDITERKETEAELENIHQQLVEASRRGGMAEIATNVLHNVGNVLNSVNISTGLIVASVKKSRASSLARVVGLLQEHAPDLGAFMTTDARGRHLPAHLAQLSEHLLADQAAVVGELESLRRNVEHIKEIVAMQQSYATFGGVKEMTSVVDLVEDGLRMSEGALSRHGVEVVREFEAVPSLNLEKHKILQILVNLIRNAKQACQESERTDKRLTVHVDFRAVEVSKPEANGGGRVRLSVTDNGIGIPPENLTRIFNYGFTTRKAGHGFGLHSGALAAKEMGGSLTVHSAGPGQGAVFTLELPCPTPAGRPEGSTKAAGLP